MERGHFGEERVDHPIVTAAAAPGGRDTGRIRDERHKHFASGRDRADLGEEIQIGDERVVDGNVGEVGGKPRAVGFDTGRDCGLAPADLADRALLATPSGEHLAPPLDGGRLRLGPEQRESLAGHANCRRVATGARVVHDRNERLGTPTVTIARNSNDPLPTEGCRQLSVSARGLADGQRPETAAAAHGLGEQATGRSHPLHHGLSTPPAEHQARPETRDTDGDTWVMAGEQHRRDQDGGAAGCELAGAQTEQQTRAIRWCETKHPARRHGCTSPLTAAGSFD